MNFPAFICRKLKLMQPSWKSNKGNKVKLGYLLMVFLDNGTISRFPLQLSYYAWRNVAVRAENYPQGMKDFGMCRSNVSPLGLLESESLLWILLRYSAPLCMSLLTLVCLSLDCNPMLPHSEHTLYVLDFPWTISVSIHVCFCEMRT